jgi:hypothetical protein
MPASRAAAESREQWERASRRAAAEIAMQDEPITLAARLAEAERQLPELRKEKEAGR